MRWMYLKRIKADIDYLSSDPFLHLCKNAPTDFTRRRKMPCERLVASTLARKGRTLKIELREFGKVASMEEISVPGYLKQREKLNPLAILKLARFHATNIYASEDVMTYKGYLLLSIDGTTANLPTNEETIERYGNTSGHGKAQAMCGMSAIFDSLNRQIINMTIGRGTFDERAEVPIHLDSIAEVTGKYPFILVMDRGYPSLALMAKLADAHIPYIIRGYSSFLSKEFSQAQSGGGDVCLAVELDYNRLAWMRKNNPEAYETLKKRDSIEARFVLVDIGCDTPERIITNLDQDEFSVFDIKEIYHLRWNIETCFAMLKDKLQVENFSGTKPVLIEQDIFASVYLLNLAYDLANEADRKNTTKPPTYKHEMTVNKSFAIGVVKEEVLRLILAPEDKRKAMMTSLVEELRKNLVPIRTNRSYGRRVTKSARHNRNSNTHKRVF